MSTSDDSTVQGVHDVAGRLYDLCTAGEYDKVKKILDTHGQRAIAKGLFGYNPLHAAASSGHYKIIELLLQFGADANCKTADGGYTPLHLAASAGQASSVKALLEDEKTDLRVTDAFGRTPTETAEQNFKTDVARSLRSHEIIRAAGQKGSNLDALLKIDRRRLEDHCYERALKVAVVKNNCTNAEKLIFVGAENIEEVMKCSERVDIALMLLMIKAAKENNYKLLRTLLKNPASEEITKYFTLPENEQPSNEAVAVVSDEIVPVVDGSEVKCTLSPDKIVKHVSEEKMRTKVPIKIALKLNHNKVLDELLFITNIDADNGSVGWNDLSLTEVEIKWLRKVSIVIKHLDISQNQLNCLPAVPALASCLKRCTKLDLHRNNIREIPPSILELPCIKEIDLSYNKLSSLPNISWSDSLIRFNLSHNELRSLPDRSTNKCSASMKELWLGYNRFREVPNCICILSNLNSLDISFNSDIIILPVALGRLKELNTLTVKGLHRLFDPPLSICEDTKICVSYLKSRFVKLGKYFHMKLMLVGKQEVGKTTMVGCLRDRPIEKGHTVGVDICEWRYRPHSLYGTYFYFSVWDFAGQVEYYATHQVFLSKRSLYLAVWKVTEGEKGIRELESWLSNIILRAPQSCIIIVGTHLDLLVSELGKEAANAKCAEYTQIFHNNLDQSFIEKNVFCITYVGLEGKQIGVTDLKLKIYNAASEYRINGHAVMGSDIPTSYKLVDRELLKQSKPVLQTGEFNDLVRNLHQADLQSNDEIRAAALFLHDIGSLLHFDDHRHNLDDLYFINPQWLCKLMSTVITVKERNEHVVNGVISKTDLHKLFQSAKEPYSDSFLEQYLVLFNRFEIALALDKQADTFLIPNFLPAVRPVVDELEGEEFCYIRHFLFETATPPGLWSRLLSRLINTIDDVKELLNQLDSPSQQHSNENIQYWATGLCCFANDLRFCIKSCRIGGNDGITITVSLAAEQRGIMSRLVNLVQQIVNEWFPGLAGKCGQIFPCYECAKSCIDNKAMFKVKDLLPNLCEQTNLSCDVCHKEVQLKLLAPDLLLDDMTTFDFENVQLSENVMWRGKFGKALQGELDNGDGQVKSVIAKQYVMCEEAFNEKNFALFEEVLRNFRAEVAYLQKANHPCLAAIIGVCNYPNVTLVMEDGPLGTLDMCLLKERLPVSRIVVYRIAAQVTSALRFLHTIPVIYRHLTSTRVLMWSLCLDNLINCKLADLELATYGDVGGIEAGQFVAPEVRQQAIYDYRVDIFSLGLLFLLMMQRSYPIEQRQSIPIWETPTSYEFISVPDSELYHMENLVKQCCQPNPTNRPDLSNVVQHLCDPVFQLVMGVTCLHNAYSISCVCAGTLSGFAWLCHQGIDGANISMFTMKGMETDRKCFIKDHQICCMSPHQDAVWATTRLANRKGALVKVERKEDQCSYVEIPIQTEEDNDDASPKGDYGTCLTFSDNHVYVGTANGWCLMFASGLDPQINETVLLIKQQKVSDKPIHSLVVIKSMSLLWVSTGHQILFVKLEDLTFDEEMKEIDVGQLVGKFFISSDAEIVWSVRIHGHTISAWNVQQRICVCNLNSYDLVDRKCDKQKSKILSANIARDTLWLGLISGHIVVVSATFPENLLTVMKPYNELVQFLVPLYEVEDDMTMLSIGKCYQSEKVIDTSNSRYCSDAVVWEALDAKYMHQISQLSSGDVWLNDATLSKVNEPLCSTLQQQPTVSINETLVENTSTTEGSSSILPDCFVILNTEQCPLPDCDIVSVKFDHDGGKLLIKGYSITITVPKGAILVGDVVQIQAAASLFGPYAIPEGLHPISAYVWLGACYTFKKRIQVEIEHHVFVSRLEDSEELCLLTACDKDRTIGPSLLEMHEETHVELQVTIDGSFGCFSTDHFCSYCLAKKSERIIDRIAAYHVVPNNYRSVDEFKSEICFCYDLEPCTMRVEKRFTDRQMTQKSSCLIYDVAVTSNENETLCLYYKSDVTNGWNITCLHYDKIDTKKINFRIWYQEVAELEAAENRDHFPPRFIIEFNCCNPTIMLSVNYTVQVKRNETVRNAVPFHLFVPPKKSTLTDIQKKRDVFKDMYDKLMNVLDVANLSKYFVAARIISIDDVDVINKTFEQDKRAHIVLSVVSHSLEAGFSGMFDDMLSIMETHGNQTNQELTREMQRLI